MENHMKNRPKRIPLSNIEQNKILEMAIEKIKQDLLPDRGISKIIIFGSLASKQFGKYDKPFHGRLYSDIDVLLLVEGVYKPKPEWKQHFKCGLYTVYEAPKLNGEYNIQYMMCKASSYRKKENRQEAEKWGVPLKLDKSKHKHIIIYQKVK